MNIMPVTRIFSKFNGCDSLEIEQNTIYRFRFDFIIYQVIVPTKDRTSLDFIFNNRDELFEIEYVTTKQNGIESTYVTKVSVCKL